MRRKTSFIDLILIFADIEQVSHLNDRKNTIENCFSFVITESPIVIWHQLNSRRERWKSFYTRQHVSEENESRFSLPRTKTSSTINCCFANLKLTLFDFSLNKKRIRLTLTRTLMSSFVSLKFHHESSDQPISILNRFHWKKRSLDDSSRQRKTEFNRRSSSSLNSSRRFMFK